VGELQRLRKDAVVTRYETELHAQRGLEGGVVFDTDLRHEEPSDLCEDEPQLTGGSITCGTRLVRI